LNSRKEGNIRIQDKNKLEITTSNRSSSFPFVEIGYTTINDTDFFPTLISTKDLNECFKKITQTQDVQYSEYSGHYFSLSNISVYQNIIDKSKILFLDRDGIINKSVGHRKYVTKFEDFDFVEEKHNDPTALNKSGTASKFEVLKDFDFIPYDDSLMMMTVLNFDKKRHFDKIKTWKELNEYHDNLYIQ
jgi:hypothetical protein